MAKKQTFGDKVGKQKATSKNHLKLIRSNRDAKSGFLRFYDEMVHIPDGTSADTVVKELLSKKA